MDTIFAVSRDYIEPLYKNAVGYDFKLQAYSDFSMALKGLSLTNKCDLIGVAILDDDIYDLKGFLRFIKSFKLLEDIPLLIMLNKKSKAMSQIPKLGVKAVVDTSQEFFTDITINQDVFGYLLLKRFDPYIIKPVKPETPDYSVPTLHYKPIFSPVALKILKPPDFQHKISDTYDNDTIYAEMEDKDSLLAKLRLLYLKRWLGENDSKLHKEISATVNKIEDVDLFCLYSALLYEIGGC